MTPTEQIAALGTALRQMREATHKLSDIYDAIWVKMSDEEMGLIRACWADMDAAVALPVPTPADLATLARWAEIGRLVEMMPDGFCLSPSKNKGRWYCGLGGGMMEVRPDPLPALRAALEPEAPK